LHGEGNHAVALQMHNVQACHQRKAFTRRLDKTRFYQNGDLNGGERRAAMVFVTIRRDKCPAATLTLYM
jgi:hypothetical protein